jgi:hypothetical protein
MTGLLFYAAFPQGLKPAIFLFHSGTTEVVPCYKATGHGSLQG